MKKILIAAALAGAIVGTFATLGFAAPLPAQLDNARSPAIGNVAQGCGPHRHRVPGFRDRYGRRVPPRCVWDRGWHR
ncbi:MAG TPA: hypothetical protein VKV32_10560 [Stellaceae bacterium]|nr:hypothetical protein [Stellaceae bacterium]